MNCRTCGTFLAEDMNVCPQCGTLTAHSPRDPGSDDSTIPASLAGQSFPATSYGPEQQIPPPPPQYDGSGPYETTAPYHHPQDPYHSMPPLQSPPRKSRKGPAVFVIGFLLLLVIASVAGLVLFNTYKLPGSQATKSAAPAATTTPNPSENPYSSGMGTLVMNDPMQDNSKGYGWDQFKTALTACQFTAGAYEINTPTHIFQQCNARSSPQFSNFVFEAQMKIVKGDCGAILFRIDTTNNNFYDFEVCLNGRYELDLHTGKAKLPFKRLIPLLPGLVIHSGPGQDNVLAVVANGDTFHLYVNHKQIDSVTDSTYSQGQIGVYGSGYFGDPTEVIFSNAKVWTL